MEIHQFATSLSYGDAISDEMLEIQKILREEGFRSEIFVRFCHPRMAGYAKDYREYRNLSSPENIVIFHFSIGSPVSKMFFHIQDKRIMIYHNITPHLFFVDYHRILARECYKGRLEIRLFVNKVDMALGDSEFNRKELEEMGYSRTGVLPLIVDFSKFDQEGDPVIREVFSTRKTTILYVGRLIPNKKFEEVIKTFYFYQKHFNPESQLILAGDYRGLERYHAALQELVQRLQVKNVHITGHLELSELVAFYRLADIYLSLSEHEGFGVPLVESFYMSVPVAAYAAGAVGETMNGGGVLLFEKDFLTTAALLDRIAGEASLRQNLIDSQLKALRKYERENVRKILLRYVEEVSKR